MSWSPESLFKLSGSYWQACALQAAVKMRVFDALADTGAEIREVAKRVSASERGVTLLLNALVALDFVVKKGTLYFPTDDSQKYLMSSSPAYLGNSLLHHHYLMDSWTHLDEAVRVGTAVQDGDVYSQSEERRSAFLLSMLASGQRTAPLVAAGIDLSGCARLLDLGGGPGTYAIHFCLKNPGLKATVFDLATTEPYARETIKKFGLVDRIDFSGGNFLKDTIPGSYDVVWLSHILHSENEKGCEAMIRNAAQTLAPGGRLFVHEFLLDDSFAAPVFAALFALNMLVRTAGGRSYSESEVKVMLEAAGLVNVKRVPLTLPNESGVLMATKK